MAAAEIFRREHLLVLHKDYVPFYSVSSISSAISPPRASRCRHRLSCLWRQRFWWTHRREGDQWMMDLEELLESRDQGECRWPGPYSVMIFFPRSQIWIGGGSLAYTTPLLDRTHAICYVHHAATLCRIKLLYRSDPAHPPADLTLKSLHALNARDAGCSWLKIMPRQIRGYTVPSTGLPSENKIQCYKYQARRLQTLPFLMVVSTSSVCTHCWHAVHWYVWFFFPQIGPKQIRDLRERKLLVTEKVWLSEMPSKVTVYW